ncbi:MAG: hypothetical protein Q7U96_04650, partial [Chloroflexota bacterium]|nr:hypothetical protein [Chloroflexota bacterium]
GITGLRAMSRIVTMLKMQGALLAGAVMRAVSPVGEGHAGTDMLSRMVEELSSTVRFYNDSHKDAALASDTPLYLTGGLVADPALRHAMEGTFPYPIVSLEASFVCPPGFPVAQYAVNLGLAMKQF